ITEGPSFRIGRALTFLPRKLRDLTRGSDRSPANGHSHPAAVSTSRSLPSTPPPPLRAPATAIAPARSATPDVSFIIPVYNSAPWLDDCISSVLAQSGVDVEVICINDGSTD